MKLTKMQEKRNLRKETISNQPVFYREKSPISTKENSARITPQNCVSPNMNNQPKNAHKKNAINRGENVSKLFYNIRLISKAFSAWKHYIHTVISKENSFAEPEQHLSQQILPENHTAGTIEMLEASLEKYEKISHSQHPHTKSRIMNCTEELYISPFKSKTANFTNPISDVFFIFSLLN